MKAKKYVFREGHQIKTKDPRVVASELERIRKATGSLTARNVWMQSRKRTAPLHNEFEWDDSKAACLFRDYQAGTVIRSVKVIYDDSHETRAYYHVTVGDEPRYEPVDVVLGNPDLYTQALAEARTYLISGQRKLAELTRAADINKKLSEVVAMIDAELAA